MFYAAAMTGKNIKLSLTKRLEKMRITSIAFSTALSFFLKPLYAQTKATWIWYPGDFEISLSNQMQAKRTERNAFIPPFWRVYSHQIVVNFSKNYDLPAAGGNYGNSRRPVQRND
jgi:hypothetical protein